LPPQKHIPQQQTAEEEEELFFASSSPKIIIVIPSSFLTDARRPPFPRTCGSNWQACSASREEVR
jgi:hypothetical protein